MPRLSEPHRPPRAVLDADIIYSRVLHELMGRVASDLRLLDLFWSEELLAEARKSLVEKKGLASGGQPVEDLLAAIERAGAPVLASKARQSRSS